MTSPRALVTGGTGFIGRRLIAQLTADGWHVTSAIRATPEGLQPGTIALGSVPWEAATFASAIAEARPDVVFHMAGVTFAESAAAFYATNVTMGAHLLDAVWASDIRPAVVLAGSAAEYGYVAEDQLPVREDMACAPLTHNGISKQAQTQLGMAFARAGLSVMVARIFNPIGAGMPEHLALGSFAAQIRSARPMMSVGNLSVARDFIEVAETARLISALASDKANFGHIFNICSGCAYSLRDLVEQMIALSGHKIDLQVATDRVRPREMRSFRGSTARLTAAGLTPRPPDFSRVLAELMTV